MTLSTSTKSSYTKVFGSDALKTSTTTETLRIIESSDRSERVHVKFQGQVLKHVFVRDPAVPVLLEVFDRLALEQGPLEQALYFHLYRLSLGNQRNFCRVPKRELMTRLNVSERRFNKILAGLVEKKHVALVDRNRKGTLYRLFLPDDVFRQKSPSAPQKLAQEPPKAKSAHKETTKNVPSISPGKLARHFCESNPNHRHDDVLEEILEALAEGHSLAHVQSALLRFSKEAPRETPMAALGKWLDQSQ